MLCIFSVPNFNTDPDNIFFASIQAVGRGFYPGSGADLHAGGPGTDFPEILDIGLTNVQSGPNAKKVTSFEFRKACQQKLLPAFSQGSTNKKKGGFFVFKVKFSKIKTV